METLEKKARLSVFGRPATPSGFLWLDKTISLILGLKGDFVPDFRLIDYLVALHSTGQSPALDGTPGNQDRLKRDLAQLGVFDESMSLYLLYKQRAEGVMGFSGFEGRHYSLFENLTHDFSEAAGLQALLTSLAFKYIADGTVTHGDIPDDPTTESERRQFLFAAAIGLRTCNVRGSHANRFLEKILSKTRETRPSRRYPDCLKVKSRDYCRALLRTLREDAPDLIESFNLSDSLDRLRLRIEYPEEYAASGRLTRGILDQAGVRSPMKLSGIEFNSAAEKYYRGTLRSRHMEEGLEGLERDLREIDLDRPGDRRHREIATGIIGTRNAGDFLCSLKSSLLSGEIDEGSLARCIRLTLLAIRRDREGVESGVDRGPS